MAAVWDTGGEVGEKVRDRERLVLTVGERERERAAASFQSRTWPPSSSAERSLALGEEERVETLLRPLNGSHSSAGGSAV